MKAIIIQEKICDSALDAVHGMFRSIKRLIIKTPITSISIRPGTFQFSRVDEVGIAVTPDGNQLYVNRFDLESARIEKGLQILGVIELDDKLAKEIVEFFLAKEKFELHQEEFKQLLAGIKDQKDDKS